MSRQTDHSRRRVLAGLAAAAGGGVLAGCLTDRDTGPDGGGRTDADCPGGPVHEGYPEARVAVATPDGGRLGSVTAAVADTDDARRTGLSETACLPPDRGMLFVYDRSRSLTFWMIDMSFGIDIVYADGDGVITSIHRADAPGPDESGTERHHRYHGTGRYVLEVTGHWTTERGVETGDIVSFDGAGQTRRGETASTTAAASNR